MVFHGRKFKGEPASAERGSMSRSASAPRPSAAGHRPALRICFLDPSFPDDIYSPMDQTESDAELIAAVLKGSTVSFEPLVQKYSPRLFATARRYARRESEVEDIVQETWSKAYAHLASFRGDAPFEHW